MVQKQKQQLGPTVTFRDGLSWLKLKGLRKCRCLAWAAASTVKLWAWLDLFPVSDYCQWALRTAQLLWREGRWNHWCTALHILSDRSDSVLRRGLTFHLEVDLMSVRWYPGTECCVTPEVLYSYMFHLADHQNIFHPHQIESHWVLLTYLTCTVCEGFWDPSERSTLTRFITNSSF